MFGILEQVLKEGDRIVSSLQCRTAADLEHLGGKKIPLKM